MKCNHMQQIQNKHDLQRTPGLLNVIRIVIKYANFYPSIFFCFENCRVSAKPSERFTFKELNNIRKA